MACKADRRSILVRAECPYVQCSLLLMLLYTEVLVVEGYKLVERGIAPKSVCVCVQVFECMLSTLPLLGVVQRVLSRVPPSPFIVCKGRGRVTVSRCTQLERKGPKVLPVPSFPLSSCIHTVVVVVVVCRGYICITVEAARPYPDTVS
jgi:hypothetical protein